MRVPQGCLRQRGRPEGRPFGSVQTALYTALLDSHPRGIRLFTCQRARLGILTHFCKSASQNFTQTSLAAFAAVVVIPVRGGGIVSAVLPLSTGCRENYFRDLFDGFHRLKALSGPFLSASHPNGLDRLKTESEIRFGVIVCRRGKPWQRAINIFIAAVQAPRPMSTGGR